ncbi:hypothetical protein QEP77_07320 [Serratia sp. B1]|nr:hypothetical protein QEP77_07320 [Serratia sp. B1]
MQFELDPATLHIAAGPVPINLAQPAQQVTDLTATPRRASWRWPQRAINVSARLEGGDLRLSFSSDRPQTLNWYHMPQGKRCCCRSAKAAASRWTTRSGVIT